MYFFKPFATYLLSRIINKYRPANFNLLHHELSLSHLHNTWFPNFTQLMDNPNGTILFSTVGRPTYGFDVFSIKLPSDLTTSKLSSSDELRLTDGVSINYNAQFTAVHQQNDAQSIVFISERTGFPAIYQSNPQSPKPQQLSLIPDSLFYDRPVIRNDHLYFISAHEKPAQLFKSWCALYYTDLQTQSNKITRLTPHEAVDFSPAVSLSGKYIAVASYGSRPWAGEFHELNTDIIVFKESDPDNRVVICQKGGWPTWSGDSTIYFHRQADDGWWSIYQVKFQDDLSGFPISPTRVTPPGVHCFTPAAFHDDKTIAVATRRRGKAHRHIEIFNVESNTFYPVTELLNPYLHHYNPFVSQDSLSIGYHRFRGKSGPGETRIHNFDPVKSPIDSLRMLRLNGNFPSHSPAGDLIAFNPDFQESNGGLKIIKSNGSKRWTLIKNRIAFYNCWSPTEGHVIFTSLGPIFEAPRTPVQIARVSFKLSDLKSNMEEIPCDVKLLTKEDTGNNAFPSCSPDGKSIVFRSGRNGHKNLYIMDAAEGEFNGSIRQLTEGACIDTMPSWSPKGNLIAFSSNRHNPDNVEAFSIYVIRPDGSELKRVEVTGSDRERLNHVCFSNDGEWLLFAANVGSVTGEPVSWPNHFQPYGDLYLVRVDGSGLRRVTWNGFENGTPAWHSGNEVDLGSLSLDEDVGEKLTGKFDDLLWINCDI